MAEITRRRLGELLRDLFEILLRTPDGMQARDALAALAPEVKLTAYEAGDYESGGRRFEKIVRFATVDTVKAGWLEKTKGRWSVTDQGKQAVGKYADPEAFYREAVKLYRQWKASRPESEPESDEEPTDRTSAKATSITYEEAEEQAWAEIEAYLREMNPYDFQELVASLLRGMGYHVSWVAPPGKDGGTDILAWSDPLGTRPPRIKVQVKRQDQPINVDGLRSFMALLGDEDVGLFVSAGGFTKDAHEEARTQEKRRVTLVDLERLVDMWIEHYGKLEEPARRRLPLQPIWFLAPES
ncbi:MAG: restriction endonuclease [Nitrospirae bacterium]|nr:restriction endonuclease [Nitrospirota bacterium]